MLFDELFDWIIDLEFVFKINLRGNGAFEPSGSKQIRAKTSAEIKRRFSVTVS
jgi:hypothetical protein